MTQIKKALSLGSKVNEIVSVTDFGYKADGSTGMSSIINEAAAYAAAIGAPLSVPSGTAIIDNTVLFTDDNPFGPCDNLHVILEAGVIWKQTTTPTDQLMIEIDGVENVVVEGYGATIDGNRANIVGWPAYGSTNLAGAPAIRPNCLTVGNFGTTTNITIKGLTLINPAQDNIYVRGANDGIRLVDLICTGAGRNNLSVVTATNFRAINCDFNNAYQWFTDDFGFGVDVEPNAATEVLDDVQFINCRAKENYDGGYNVLLSNLNASSTVDTTVKFINCSDDKGGWDTNGSAYHSSLSYGFGYTGPNAAATIRTYVDFEKCTAKNSGRYSLFVTRKAANLGRLTADIHCEDWNRQASSSSVNNGAYGIKSDDTGAQSFPVHLKGTAHKKDRVAGEYIITHANAGDAEYDNVWFGDIQVSGELDPRVEGITGLTSSSMLGSTALGRGPRSSFPLKPYGVHVAGGTQSINNNTITKVSFTTESGGANYNFGRDFSIANDEWEPKEPGLYLVTVQHKYASAVDNSRVYITLYEDPNTGTFAEKARQESVMVGTSTNQNYVFQQVVLVPALDYKYDVRVLQVTGGAIDLNALVFTATKLT